MNEQFKVDGYDYAETQTAVHEAGHAVAALRPSAMATLHDGDLRVRDIILRGEDRQTREAGVCHSNGILGDIDGIIFSLAGHQAARACGFPRDYFSPGFGRHQYRDSDYECAIKEARDIYYQAWAKKELSGLSDAAVETLVRRHYCTPASDDDAEMRTWRRHYAVALDLQQRHRVSTWKLKPILDHCVRRTRQLVRRPENLRLIKILATALLQAPRDAKGDRVLTGEQINRLATV